MDLFTELQDSHPTGVQRCGGDGAADLFHHLAAKQGRFWLQNAFVNLCDYESGSQASTSKSNRI